MALTEDDKREIVEIVWGELARAGITEEVNEAAGADVKNLFRVLRTLPFLKAKLQRSGSMTLPQARVE